MIGRIWIQCGVGLASLGMCVAISQATVSVNICDGGDTGRDQRMGTNDVAGAIDRVGNWNNFAEVDLTWSGNQATLVGLIDDQGVTYPSLTFTLEVAIGNSGRIDDRDNIASLDNEETLRNGLIDNWSTTVSNRIIVANIPYTTYDVYVYMRDDGGDRAGAFEAEGTRYFALGGAGDPDTNGVGYVLSSDTDLGATNKADIVQGNYVRFDGLTNSTLTLNMAAFAPLDGDTSFPRCKVPGIQIVPQASGTVTGLVISGTTTGLLAGNPVGSQLSVTAQAAGQSGDVTVSPDTTYTAIDTNVFTVSATGLVSPELPGTSDVVVSHAGVSATQAVEVLGPTDLRLVLSPTNLFLGSTDTAGLEADFTTVSNLDVTAFGYVAFSGGPPSVLSVATDGVLTPVGVGSFSLTGTYAGVTAILDPAGNVFDPTPSTSFGVSICDDLNPAKDSIMEAGDLAGAVIRAGYWNNWVDNELTAVGGFKTLTGLVGDNGTPLSGTTVSIDPTASVQNRTNSGNNTNEVTLFAGVEDNSGGTTSVVVSNMPYASYNLYVYMRDDGAARGGAFTVDGTTLYVRGGAGDPTSDGTGYAGSTDTSGGTGTTQGNYVVFSGLTNQTLSLGIAAFNMGDGTTRCKWTGFQVTRNVSGVASNLTIEATIPTLLSGDAVGTQVSVSADIDGDTFNVTANSNTLYSSSNPSVFTVSSDGLIDPGQAGTADLIVNFQSLSATQSVEVIGPTAVRLSFTGTNLWVGALGGADPAVQAELEADFAIVSNVNVTAFDFVSFSGTPPSVVDVTVDGLVSPVGAGDFSLTGTYAGLSDSIVMAGTVEVFDAPLLAGGLTALNINIGATALPINFRDLAGAPGARSANWNDVVLSSNSGIVSNLANSVGVVQTGTVVEVTGSSAQGGSVLRTPPSGTINDPVMIRTAFDQLSNSAGTTPEGAVVVSGIPYRTYDVYCYVWNDNGQSDRPAYFAIGGVTNWLRNLDADGFPSQDGTNYIEGVTVGAPSVLADVPQANYVKFTGITLPDLVINFAAASTNLISDAATVPRVKVAGFQIVDTAAGPEMTGAAAIDGTGFVVSWASQTGETFSVSEATQLEPGDWMITANGLSATPPENTYTAQAPLTARGFVRIELEVQGPLLDDDLESGTAGWEEDPTSTGSPWELGIPTTGPTSAHSPTNCWGTDLDANYANNTDARLWSPVVDLTGVAAATLSFWQYIDSEEPSPPDHFDYGSVQVIDTNSPPNVLATLLPNIDGPGQIWEPVSVELPPGVMGQPVRIQFQFISDGSLNFWPGWYVDDIAVTEN